MLLISQVWDCFLQLDTLLNTNHFIKCIQDAFYFGISTTAVYVLSMAKEFTLLYVVSTQFPTYYRIYWMCLFQYKH